MQIMKIPWRKWSCLCSFVVVLQLLILRRYSSTSHRVSERFAAHGLQSDDAFRNLILKHQNQEVKFSDSTREKNKTKVAEEDEKVSVALCLAVTTRKRKKGKQKSLPKSVTDATFFKSLMPSFCGTGSKAYKYNFYLAFDFDDPLLSRREQLDLFVENFSLIKDKRCKRLSHVGLNFVNCSHSGRPAWAQNDAVMSAYMDNNDYLYRINDDASLSTGQWTERFIKKLSSYDPPNIGVVGPKHTGGNLHILTFDFVHRSHVDIFGYHYPREFPDWYADRWITDIYKPGRMTKLNTVRVRHNVRLGTRYTRHLVQRLHINDVIKRDKEELIRSVFSFCPLFEYVYNNHRYFVKEQYSATTNVNLRVPTLFELFFRFLDATASVLDPDPSKVIAMSLVGDDPRQTYGAVRNVMLRKLHFPEWTLRIYVEQTDNNSTLSKSTTPVSNLYPPVPTNVIAKLRSLPVELVSVDTKTIKADPSLWPLLAVDDTTVNYLLVRKPSSRLSERDAAVVSDWLDSGQAVHVIKDHPKHLCMTIVDGLWGVNTRKLTKVWNHEIRHLFKDWTNERHFVNHILWPQVGNDALIHNGIMLSPDSKPFPLERINSEYLGQEFGACGEYIIEAFDKVSKCDI